MIAGLGMRPACAAYRVLREAQITGCKSFRNLVSLTQVHHALQNMHTGAIIEPSAAQRTGHTGTSPSPTPGASETISIGQRLYSLTRCYAQKRNHPKCDDKERHMLATEAWNLLQSITEEDLEALPMRDVAEIVVTYNYFSTVWANGLHGPAKSTREGNSMGQALSSSECSIDDVRPDYPITDRPDVVSHVSKSITQSAATVAEAAAPSHMTREAPAKRASPLDDFLDF